MTSIRTGALLRLVLVLSLCLQTRTAIEAVWDDLSVDGAADDVDGAGLGSLRGEHVLQTVQEMNSALHQYNDTGLFVEFFLPWCGHSSRMRPEFRHAAAVMAGRPVFVRVDCSKREGALICQQFDVQYHPHIALMIGGKHYEYNLRATSAEFCRYFCPACLCVCGDINVQGFQIPAGRIPRDFS